ncbi:esterase [Granulicella sp. 5B5]|uniref:esterase family protein n=1 Tax=Granulicella sp. 5B5 TaxID=1617967 RepID=UPI0015F561FD|nr:alpha/beta hydrolase-fold protein [Granulicella sp. 5B5]QMV20063.1 esterase [Granulicella sp. 5B5]
MRRDYYQQHSGELGRNMEMLVYSRWDAATDPGLPVIVFPTSQGRFYEFEDKGMVRALSGKIDAGEIQLFCVDSVDSESWYNRNVGPDWRVARQEQYARYIANEVVPFIQYRNWNPKIVTAGCSFGGYHALNMALKYPWTFSGCLSMSGAFDMEKLNFLDGYHDQNAYFNMPMNYMPNQHDGATLDRMRQNTYVLATGVHDQCWNDNERMAAILRGKGIPVQLHVWGGDTGHDWPWWQQQAQQYL